MKLVLISIIFIVNISLLKFKLMKKLNRYLLLFHINIIKLKKVFQILNSFNNLLKFKVKKFKKMIEPFSVILNFNIFFVLR